MGKHVQPACRPECTVTGAAYRISILTDRMIRLEYQEDQQFIDEKTQMVVNRYFPPVDFSCQKEDGFIRIETKKLIIRYDGKPFSRQGLTIKLKENGFVWQYGELYGDDGNLGGTARTLDVTNGIVELEKGIFSHTGCVALDDSTSALVTEDGIKERQTGGTDLYFFGFGKDFLGGLQEFFELCGKSPMIPRYALGNWWSRYHRYSEESYLQMLDDFEKEKIPVSVAVIDMDWHITEIDPKYGNGWTGFSWDKELFPDYRRFLKTLHKRNLAVTLNLHPADGIRAYEDMYPQAAEHAGIDPETEETVEFDLSDETFRKIYFEDVLHPYEKDGVDFWWIDWQQGTQAGKTSIDPLWLLNHYHYQDQEERNVRPMIFSRYAGVGSHRYPIGFSGDTFCTWESLEIQPWFTSTASNIGYGWWSHDIGGHMQGDKDQERLVRWIQFGVFSPIMRLHSSSNPFFVKEPWKLEEPYRSIAGDAMRLRHQLVPYLYTMCYRAWKDGLPLIQPVYYRYPCDELAYEAPNQYFFGTELLVGAIAQKKDPDIQMAPVNCYLPAGRWYDIFTGRVYSGRRKRNLYRKLDTIPVLLKAGGILPLASLDENGENDSLTGVDAPKSLDLYIGVGADGSFSLYEDDGISNDYQDGIGVTTQIDTYYDEDSEQTRVVIHPAEGSTELIPAERTWNVILIGAKGDGNKKVQTISIDTSAGAEVVFENCELAGNDKKQEVFELLEYAWISMNLKEKLYGLLCRSDDDREFLILLENMDIPVRLRDAIFEIYADL